MERSGIPAESREATNPKVASFYQNHDEKTMACIVECKYERLCILQNSSGRDTEL